MNVALSRRRFLASGTALVVSFALSPRVRAQGAAKLPGSLDKSPMLDSWIGVGGDGTITVFTGKAELGQGIRTALCQVAAEELGVPFERITLVTADTARTPDEGYTAGSNSMKDSGTAILNAAAQARELLLGEAAKKWNARPNTLTPTRRCLPARSASSSMDSGRAEHRHRHGQPAGFRADPPVPSA